jgi:hypothetical protein
MAGIVDRISDRDDAEAARTAKIAFASLLRALKDRVSKYNNRHPQQFTTTVSIKGGYLHGTQRSLNIEKNTEPRSSLNLDFPINSGAMLFKLSSTTGNFSGTIKVAVEHNQPTYDFGGKMHSTESLADLLFQVLSSTEPLAEMRTTGFV